MMRCAAIVPVVLLAIGITAGAAAAQAADALAVDTTPSPPRVVNVETLEARLQSRYPDRFRRLELAAHATYAVLVNAGGRMDSVRLAVSTGVPALDTALRSALDAARFEPARLAGEAIASWFEVSALVHPSEPQLLESAPPPLRVANRDFVTQLAQALHPQELRARSLGADVFVALTIDGTGRVKDHVAQPVCSEAATTAALAAAAQIRFEPTTGSEADEEWAFATVSFGRDSATVRIQGEYAAGRAAGAAATPAGDSDRAPSLRNRGAVQRELQRAYPPELRDRGLGGEVGVWLSIDEDGRVNFMHVNASSGICPLDDAAIEVARTMRFAPAVREGRRVAVWVSVPIIFQAR